MFKDLLYEIGTKSRSAKVHGMLFGIHSLSFKASNLDTSFRFSCKKLGNCCRGRHMTANRIVGSKQIQDILNYCRTNDIPVEGLMSDRRSKVLMLSGHDKGEVVARSFVDQNGIGIAHIGGAKGYDCQFLDKNNLCKIHPVKPLICRLAPVGLIFEHLDYGGRLLFAVQDKRECRECMKGDEWRVGEWIQKNTSAEEMNEWINDVRADSGYLRLNRRRRDGE